ncbi:MULTISPECIES: Hsp20 family protein [Curvivirga]|uniref:Hsp20 family protein n=1 Tax=Curvivirga TaxID=2856846 RepID=UPI0012BC71AA|nr:Hsp20 family protein [Curvivirga aplysinae]MTI11102.1 Hsp20 family protein [Curvivirga aplysinae]
MRDLDFSPLFRNAIGFDRMARLMDNIASEGAGNSYPPYNIEQLDENGYQISMAVAGFSDNELDIEVLENQLKVTGKKDLDQDSEDQRNFLHRGIAQRAFERRFSLADYIKVTGAKLEHGLLHIKLVRDIPEAKKPKAVQIETSAPKSLEA